MKPNSRLQIGKLYHGWKMRKIELYMKLTGACPEPVDEIFFSTHSPGIKDLRVYIEKGTRGLRCL
jgi:hypothetical protein